MASYENIDISTNSRFVSLPETGPYDLYVQGVFTDIFEGYMSFSVGNPSAKVAGLIKLSQEYLITLMTSRNSDIFEPNKGTAMASLVGGNYGDEQELRITISESVSSAGRQVIDRQSLVRPPTLNETLKTAELTSLTIISDYVRPVVLLTSEAGQFSEISLPELKTFTS